MNVKLGIFWVMREQFVYGGFLESGFLSFGLKFREFLDFQYFFKWIETQMISFSSWVGFGNKLFYIFGKFKFTTLGDSLLITWEF